jgi:hypothetical protein
VGFDPIEEAFPKVERLIRGVEARIREVLIEAIGKALGAVTTEDAQGFFAHCGYRAPAQ